MKQAMFLFGMLVGLSAYAVSPEAQKTPTPLQQKKQELRKEIQETRAKLKGQREQMKQLREESKGNSPVKGSETTAPVAQ